MAFNSSTRMVYGVFNPNQRKNKIKDPDIVKPDGNSSNVEYAEDSSPPETDTLTLDLDRDLVLKLAIKAHEHNITLNELAIRILKHGVNLPVASRALQNLANAKVILEKKDEIK